MTLSRAKLSASLFGSAGTHGACFASSTTFWIIALRSLTSEVALFSETVPPQPLKIVVENNNAASADFLRDLLPVRRRISPQPRYNPTLHATLCIGSLRDMPKHACRITDE